MKTFAAICAIVFCQAAHAQMYKCTDKAGKTTYSSQPCNELGLKDAGAIPDRIQVTPAPVFQPAPGSPSRPRVAEQPAPEKPAAAAEPAKQPERRCFTTTVKGKSVTRCNDKPEEDSQ